MGGWVYCNLCVHACVYLYSPVGQCYSNHDLWKLCCHFGRPNFHMEKFLCVDFVINTRS
uniref:Structural maintenance of chromosomes protein 1 isoform X1 n=1 Tax=Rhizophora mucronata TaxID=61149 RepID=A0A2P2PRP4_RHIMU